MNRSNMSRAAIAFAAAGLLPAALASAQAVNGYKVNPRVFNDFSTSTVVITATPGNPSNVSISDTLMVDDGAGGSFANRHDVVASSDGGTTARSFSITEGFTVSALVNLAPLSATPRKEAGLRINSGITGDVLLLVNSDAGEIVAFGGGAPFKLFGSTGSGNGYTNGTSILLGMTYTPDDGDADTKGTIEYFIDRDPVGPGGFDTSGPMNFDNLEGGPINFQVGGYGQFSPNLGGAAPDGVVLGLSALTVSLVPEPTTLATLGLAGALLGRRRRS